MRLAALLLFGFLLTPALAMAESQAHKGPRLGVCLAPQAELLRRLVPEPMEIDVLLPSGADHESYEPSIGQLIAISRGTLFFKVGHPKFSLENALLKKILSLNTAVRIVDSSEGLVLDPDDIHYWTSPKHLVQITRNMAKSLKAIFPLQISQIDLNRDALISEIEALDRRLLQLLAPFKDRSFLVFHPSWGYFAQDYSLVQLAVEHDGKEPSVLRLQSLLLRAKKEHIHTIFVEPGTARDSVSLIANELNAHTETLNPLDDNWLDYLENAGHRIASSFALEAP